MEIKEILEQLEPLEDGQRFPFEAIAEAVRQREEITPYLLQALDGAYESTQSEDGEYDSNLYFYGMWLLGQFQEQEAFPKILRFLTLDEETLDILIGDLLTSGMSSILYSTYNGDLDSLRAVAEDESLDPFARIVPVDVMSALHHDGRLPRDFFVGYLRELMSRAKEGEDPFPDALARIAEENHLFELVEDVRKMFLDKKMDLTYAGDFSDALDEFYTYDQRTDMPHLVTDAAKEYSSWAVFKQEGEAHNLSLEEVKQRLKTGRNEPCPCGSGKKYKKCCLEKDEKLFALYTTPVSLLPEMPLNVYPLKGAGPDRPGLEDHYGAAALSIDEVVYSGYTQLKNAKRFDRRGNRRQALEARRDGMGKLWRGYGMFAALCEQENIRSLEEYDGQYKVHYLCGEWLDELLELLEKAEDPRAGELKGALEKLGK